MKKALFPLKILITAGPTREFIDPVRYISNPSTGEIGYSLARFAFNKGHKVMLLSGPTHLKPIKGVKIIYFETALELKKEVDTYFKWSDCLICSAAVGDFRVSRASAAKIKKKDGMNSLCFKKNPDILLSLRKKKKGKIIIGFALETDNLIANAKDKLRAKKLDLIVANELSTSNMPFGNKKLTAFILSKEKIDKYTMVKKDKLARIILDRVENLCYSLKNKKEAERDKT